MIKKYKYFIAVLAGMFLAIGGTVFAGQISVPSAGSQGQTLVGLSTGNYQATSSLIVTPTGIVGIGTTNPTLVNANAKLTVAGTGSQDYIASSTDNTTLSDAIYNAYAPGSRIFMGAHGTNQVTTQYGITVGGWGEIGALNSSFGTSNGLLIGTRTTATPIVFGTNSVERMRILSTGAVGIGLTNPGSMLEIQGTSTAATGQAFIAWDSSANRIFQIANNGSTTIGNFGTCSGSNALNTNSSGTIICGATNGGVTSLTAGAGIAVSASTGAITVTNTIGYPFPGNATSTLLSLTGGINASSTVLFQNNSNGTQFNWNSGTGRLGLGTSTPYAQFALVATSTTGTNAPLFLFVLASTTAGTATSTLFSVANTGATNIFTPTNLTNAFSVTNASNLSVFNIDTTGTLPAFQIGTSSGSTPIAQLSSIALFNQMPYGNLLFALASSSQTATTTLFSVDNQGMTTITENNPVGNAVGLTVKGVAQNGIAVVENTTGEQLQFKAQDTKARIIACTLASCNNDGTLFIDGDNSGTNVATFISSASAPLVGIASTTPTATLGVQGTVMAKLTTFALNDSAVCQRGTGGFLTIDSGVSSCIVSSKYVKDYVQDDTYEGAWTRIQKIQVIEFKYKDTGTADIGAYAEDMAMIDPRYAQYAQSPRDMSGHHYEIGDAVAINWAAVQADMIVVIQHQSAGNGPSKWPYVVGLIALAYMVYNESRRRV